MDSPRTTQEQFRKFLDDMGIDYRKLGSSDVMGEPCSLTQSEDYVISDSSRKALRDIMEALTNPNIYMVGVCGKDDKQTASLLQRVQRRVMRDSLFGVTVTVSIKKNPNLTSIQQEIADVLGLSFEGHKTAFCGCVLPDCKNKVVSENARQLSERILREPNILFILCDLHERLDLEKLGIPFGAAHQGCKLILTSESEEVLSNQMNTQRTFSF